MRKLLTLASLVAVLFVGYMLTGCRVINGSGNAATETREVSDFDSVSLAADGDLILTQDGTETLTIKADDNVLPVIETFVRRGTLIIKFRDNVNLRTKTPIRYTLSVKHLEEIKILGDGNVTASDLDAAELQLKIQGDGDIVVGDVDAPDQFDVDVQGDGSVTVGTVDTHEASVNISGDGDVTIPSLTAQTLKTTISGDGSVTVAGEATTQKIDVTGNGNIAANELRSSNAEIDSNGDGNVSVWVLETMEVKISGDGDVAYVGSPQIDHSVSGDGKLVNVRER